MLITYWSRLTVTLCTILNGQHVKIVLTINQQYKIQQNTKCDLNWKPHIKLLRIQNFISINPFLLEIRPTLRQFLNNFDQNLVSYRN